MMRGNRNMRRMVNKLGVDMHELPDIKEVLIRTTSKEIILPTPTVTEMESNKDRIFTIVAQDYEERELETKSFPDADVDFVRERTGVDQARAVGALEESNGDLAQAIMILTSE